MTLKNKSLFLFLLFFFLLLPPLFFFIRAVIDLKKQISFLELENTDLLERRQSLDFIIRGLSDINNLDKDLLYVIYQNLFISGEKGVFFLRL